MKVKPAPGLKVRDPKTKRHLPEEGKEVPASTFWMRRLRDGDVVEVKVVEKAKLAEFEKPKKSAPPPAPTQDQE